MSSGQAEIRAALDAVDAAHARLRATCSDAVGNAFRVEVSQRLEAQCRVNRGLMYRFVGELVEPPDGPYDPDLPAGTVMSKLLWQRLRITPGEVRRRMRIATRIRPRRSLTGPVLPPELPHLAIAVEDGEVGDDHIAAVCHALDVLPSVVPDGKRDKAERILCATEDVKTPSSWLPSVGESPITSTLTACSTRTIAPAAAGCVWPHKVLTA